MVAAESALIMLAAYVDQPRFSTLPMLDTFFSVRTYRDTYFSVGTYSCCG